MGAWGVKALESDEGLDLICFLEDYISNIEKKYVDFELSEILEILKGNLLGNSVEEIDFLYDNTAIGLAELYIGFCENGKISFDNEDETLNLEKRVKTFSAEIRSLKYLHNYLINIKNEVPDKDGIRECVELWKESSSWKEWKIHLDRLILKLEKEIERHK